MPSDMPLLVKCLHGEKNIYMISVLSYDWLFWEIDFFAIIAVANIVILICCYMISSYSILSKDFPTVTETFIEYCRKYPFCTCCYFHRKGKIAKEKNGKCTICGRRKTEILQHEHWKSCYKWNNVYVCLLSDWMTVKYLYTKQPAHNTFCRWS